MANLCESLISGCIAANCDNPLYAGIDPIGYIANFADIASVTYDETNPAIITGITMKTDTVGSSQVSRCFYTVQQLGSKPFDGSQVEMNEGTYANRFTNTVQFAVLDNSPETVQNVVTQLANGRFVVILKNDFKGEDGKSKYSVFGIKKGLKASSIQRELWGDNESAWICTMVEENSPSAGLFFYTTSESATDTAINALLCNCNE